MRRHQSSRQIGHGRIAVAIWIVCGLVSSTLPAEAEPTHLPGATDLEALYASRDFFSLRDQITGDSGSEVVPPEHRFFAAAVQLEFTSEIALEDGKNRLAIVCIPVL